MLHAVEWLLYILNGLSKRMHVYVNRCTSFRFEDGGKCLTDSKTETFCKHHAEIWSLLQYLEDIFMDLIEYNGLTATTELESCALQELQNFFKKLRTSYMMTSSTGDRHWWYRNDTQTEAAIGRCYSLNLINGTLCTHYLDRCFTTLQDMAHTTAFRLQPQLSPNLCYVKHMTKFSSLITTQDICNDMENCMA